MLNIKNLYVSVNGKTILNGLNLTIRPGEVHAIMGPNGSGKSTLAYALLGHPSYRVGNSKSQIPNLKQNQKSKIQNHKFTIKLDGKSLVGITPDQRARMGMFLAFQYPITIEGVSVQNFLRKASEAVNGKSKMSVLEFRKKLIVEAKKLGVKEELLKRSLNDGFSGGEKKRVEILQMAILKPKYAVLDETDSGLDIDALKTVARGVGKIVRSDKKLGVVLITHYQRILRFIRPDFVHVIVGGKIVKSGGRGLATELEKRGYKHYE